MGPPNNGNKPFPARKHVPIIEVRFQRPTVLRAVAILARNLPREVKFLADGNEDGPTLEFRPEGDHPAGVQQPHIWSEDFLHMVNEEIPYGEAPSEQVYSNSQCFHLCFASPWSATRACVYKLCHVMKVDGWASI